MRELDFSQERIAGRWRRVKEFWEEELPSQLSVQVNRCLEMMLQAEFRQFVGCGAYKRSKKRKGRRNRSYRRGLQSLYGWWRSKRG